MLKFHGKGARWKAVFGDVENSSSVAQHQKITFAQLFPTAQAESVTPLGRELEDVTGLCKNNGKRLLNCSVKRSGSREDRNRRRRISRFIFVTIVQGSPSGQIAGLG